MKQLKRSGIYKERNVTFDPKTCEATSYDWWRFVAIVDGLVIFNNYKYSRTTTKHQWMVRSLLSQLGIKIDLEFPLKRGITDYIDLAELIARAEEELLQDMVWALDRHEQRLALAREKRARERAERRLANVVLKRLGLPTQTAESIDSALIQAVS